MDENTVVQIRASCQRMGQTDECQDIHIFYLFINKKLFAVIHLLAITLRAITKHVRN